MSEMGRYLQLFLEESGKHLARAEEILVSEAPSGEELEALFREIHSLKGMAASMGYTSMSELAHQLEDLLDGWRKSGAVDPADLRTALRACDRLSEMREDIADGGAGVLDWSDIRLGGGESEAAPAITPAPAPATATREECLRVRLLIDEACPTPAARAYLMLTRFKELGTLLSSRPGEEEILQGDAGYELELDLQGVTRTDVEALCESLTELQGVEFPTGLEEVGAELLPEQEVAVPPPAAPETEEPGGVSTAESTVRLPETVTIPVGLLDEFVTLVGEMTISRSRLDEAARPLGSEILTEELGRMAGLIRSLQERVMSLRTLPFGLVTGTLKRAVRSASAALGKDVDLKISGEGIGLDKTVLLQIADPLLHLVRNAVDHGLEAPEERQRRGKPQRGRIEIRATRARNCVEVVVSDDGRGIDPEKVRAKAVAAGFFTEEESRAVSGRELLGFLFRSGFSTRESVTELSGRGVGLDVVKSHVEGLGGSVDVASTHGAGTQVHLTLPLSVAIVPVLTVAVGASTLALPVGNVLRTLEASPTEIEARDGSHFFLGEEGEVPVLRLARLLHLAGARKFRRIPLALVHTPQGVLALAVDRFLREEDLFIKPLKGPMRRLKGISGYSVLGDGRLVFLLDPANLV